MMLMPEDLKYLFQEDQAVYGPWDHQRVISKLNTGLGFLYYREKSLALEPMPESMLNETEASPVPDLILVDNQTSTIPIIIEICHSPGLKKDLKKVIGLIEDDYYGIREGFVYNYKTGSWFRYRFGDGGVATESSYSEILKLDLDTFL
jgi:hypothetical protein